MSKPHWRPARASDLPAISAIAARIHPDLPERPDVLAEKMRLCPHGCLVLTFGDVIAGYGLAHPWKQQQIPPLDDFLQALPEDADCLYVHDVAILPVARGGGAARTYIVAIEALARSRNIVALALVSVYGTRDMWAHLGFQAVTADAALRAKLASYGDTATYMLCDLGKPRLTLV